MKIRRRQTINLFELNNIVVILVTFFNIDMPVKLFQELNCELSVQFDYDC